MRANLSGLLCKESACNVGDTGDVSSTPGSGRSPGGGNGNPLKYSCLKNPMNRGASQAMVQRDGCKEMDTTKHTHTHTHTHGDSGGQRSWSCYSQWGCKELVRT